MHCWIFCGIAPYCRKTCCRNQQLQHQCRQLQCQPLPIDPLSVDLYPQDGPALQPVKIYWDGNCLARSGSLLAFGTEDEHVEIKMRIACELALHSDIYQDDSFLGAGLEDGQTAWAKHYTQYSPHYCMEVLTPSAVQDMSQKETLCWVHNGTYAGPWQLHALSSVLGMSLHSIYPTYGGYKNNVRSHLQWLIFPRQPADSVPAFIIHSRHYVDFNTGQVCVSCCVASQSFCSLPAQPCWLLRFPENVMGFKKINIDWSPRFLRWHVTSSVLLFFFLIQGKIKSPVQCKWCICGKREKILNNNAVLYQNDKTRFCRVV